jgi:hypothetical protein
MAYTDPTLKKLFALSGNECAYPGCTQPVVDTELGLVVGEICHIKGKSPGGPRYDPNQSDAERNGYENLMVMCGRHNKTVDDEKTRHLFPVERLKEMKVQHEAKHAGQTVDEKALAAFVAEFYVGGSVITTYNQSGGQNAHQITNIYPEPRPPEVMLTPVIDWQLSSVDNQMGLDYYDFRLTLRNGGQTAVREFRVEIEVPNKYLNQATTYGAEVIDRRTPEKRLFRHTQANFRGFILYPKESRLVFSVGYVVPTQVYTEGTDDVITVTILSGDRRLSKTEYPISGMLNQERAERIRSAR